MIEFSLKKKLRGQSGPFLLDLSLSLKKAECVALVGPSGSGKTTVLRMLAGLSAPIEGHIHCGGQTWYDEEVNLSPQERGVGFVFQNFSLFPTMTVRKNLSFICNHESMIDEMLELMELKKLSEYLPHQLSGGQQQRVALARALISRPQFLLLDEPFSALDMQMRLKLQRALLKMRERLSLTILLVTHQISDAYQLASRVVKIEQGVLEKEKEISKEEQLQALKYTEEQLW